MNYLDKDFPVVTRVRHYPVLLRHKWAAYVLHLAQYVIDDMAYWDMGFYADNLLKLQVRADMEAVIAYVESHRIGLQEARELKDYCESYL